MTCFCSRPIGWLIRRTQGWRRAAPTRSSSEALHEPSAHDPILLTPGPLTTSLETKPAMLRDWGSWDAAFNAITATSASDLLDIVHGGATHVCVPMQGSGTFSVEAALNTLVPRDGHVLVLNNGAYGKRIARICEMTWAARRRCSRPPRTSRPRPTTSTRRSRADPSITHVALMHCETSPDPQSAAEIAGRVARHGKRLIVDAMSSFGALPIDVRASRSMRWSPRRQVHRRLRRAWAS